MASSEKIVTLKVLQRKLAKLKDEGHTIAFTNGCFDILHYGHVTYLEAAQKRNRILVVGLNSDSSVRKIKGPTRPVNSQKARAAVLAALECVHFVTIFNEATPLNLIQAVSPDVLITGSDWKGKDVVGGAWVKAQGGKVELIPYVPGFSTTRLIGNIQSCA